MFISEVQESYFCGLKEITQNIVDESNYSFCEILAEAMQQNDVSIVKEQYKEIAKRNQVAKYNWERLYNS